MWQVQQPPSPTYQPTGAPKLTGGALWARRRTRSCRSKCAPSFQRPPTSVLRCWRRGWPAEPKAETKVASTAATSMRRSSWRFCLFWAAIVAVLYYMLLGLTYPVTHGHEWYQVSSTKKKVATVVSIQHVGVTKVNRKQHFRSNAIHFRIPTPPRSSMFSRAPELLHVVGSLFTHTISLAFSQQHQAVAILAQGQGSSSGGRG